MAEIVLNDGRIFNSKYSKIENAIPEIADYLFCEYNEILNLNNITHVEVIKEEELEPLPF